MRVLHFVSTLDRNSGVMRVIMNYYMHINRERIQFDFLYFTKAEESYQTEIESLGGRTFYIEKPRVSFSSWKELEHFFCINHKEYAWVHNHECYFSIFLYTLVKKYGIRNMSVHSHLTQYSDKPVSAVRNWLLCKPITHLPIKRMACSQAAADFLYGEDSDAFVLKNKIPYEKYVFAQQSREELRKLLSIENSLVLGHIGRFVKQKNHSLLFLIFKEVLKYIPDAKLLLVGDGPLEQEMHVFAETLGITDDIIFAGKQKDVVPYLNAMDVFLLPSLFEGLPMVALEAQANGLHCVLSDTITQETASTERVTFCSIEEPKMWVEIILNINHDISERILTEEDKVRMSIEEDAKKLERYYLSVNQEE